MSYMSVVERIRDLRLRMRLPQTEFADKYGIPVSTFRQWEDGRRWPDEAAITLLRLILLDPDRIAEMIEMAVG